MSDVQEMKSDYPPIPDGMVRESYAQYLERRLIAADLYIKQLESENDALRADLLLWEQKEIK